MSVTVVRGGVGRGAGMRVGAWVTIMSAFGFTACSHYPIPDDLGSLKTEEIVRFGRCEMRTSILNHMVKRDIIINSADEEGIKAKVDSIAKKVKSGVTLTDSEKHLRRLAKVAVVYSFDFNITENNKATAGAVFKLPWLTEVFDAGVEGGVDLTRQGSRVFGAEDSWSDVITDTKICNSYNQSKNIIYPLTGSIGVGRVVETFIDIDEQGGAKDNFVDTLTFTTVINGSANAGVKLDPAPKGLRPISISGSYGASRVDIHKLQISLAFPQADVPRAITGVTRVDGDLNAPFTRPADWRARYNLCVADARARENTFKALRLEAPEVYCVRYADAFAPQYGFDSRPRRTTISPRLTPRSEQTNPALTPRMPTVPQQRRLNSIL